ncbi:MAG: DUF1887 family CARF protein [Anaerolineae bacterium]|nr:DUF1887 family protein [Thermoflexales bacterium]MDW8406896.1 DUF1887 family CARF protein [Anaerolineae bacterium]
MKRNKQKIMISLLGGRPVPNIQAALHLKPERVYFVASADSIGPGGNYQKALGGLPDAMKPDQPLRAVQPYSMRETQAACAALVAQHPDDDIVLVLASEPKMMSLGAYEFARQRSNVRVCNVTRDGLVWLSNEQKEPMKISLCDYFAAYGWQVDWSAAHTQEVALKPYQEVLNAVEQHLSVACDLFTQMRVAAQQANQNRTGQRRCACALGEEARALLQAVRNAGWLSNLQFDQSYISWSAPQRDDLNSFVLSGEWLEALVFRTAVRAGQFDACAWNIRETQQQQHTRQLDFVGIRSGEMVIASCKVGNRLERTFFEEIRARADQLGKTMCSPMLISTADNVSDDATRWGRETEVVLVTRKDLPGLDKIFRKVIDGKQDADPKHISVYPRM